MYQNCTTYKYMYFAYRKSHQKGVPKVYQMRTKGVQQNNEVSKRYKRGTKICTKGTKSMFLLLNQKMSEPVF